VALLVTRGLVIFAWAAMKFNFAESLRVLLGYVRMLCLVIFFNA